MRKIVLSLTLGLIFHLSAWAQPSILFSSGSACTDETVCIDVTVMDFTNIITTDFQITYDPTLLEFQNAVDAGNLPNFSPTDITVVTPGVLQVEWGVIPDCADDPANIGVTLADALTVYQLCFKVIGSYGSVADISIGNPPTPRITRTGSNCSNIGLLTNTGQITACVRQVEVYATEETGNTGDLVCVDFRVNGWDAMLGAQFTINWDPDVIVGEQMIVGDIPNTNTSTVVIFGNGTATVSWSYFVPGEPGITVPDSTLFFQICYRIVGDCEDFSSITFSGSPTPIEFTNDNEEFEGFNLPVLLTPGSVTVNDCDPIGLQLFADCGDVVSLNDEFCVTVSVGDNFQQISDFAYLMQWNPNILEFTSVTNVNAALNQFDFPGDFNVSNESNGILGVDWSATPGVGSQSLPAGTVLYDVCFKVIGLGGNSPFSFTNPSNVQINNGPNIGINPSNCEVQVNQPDGVAMLIGSGQSPPGEEFCVDITVANFADIIDYQFSLSWNNTLFDLTQVTNINIPGASFPGNFIDASDFGALAFDWESVSPVTLPDGGVIMTLCFNPLSDPGDCDMLEMVDIPLVAQAINTGSNGENIGIIQIDGELCTLFPEGFGITIADGQIGWLDTICLPVSVSSFDNITGAEFCISWDPVNLQFLEVNNLNTWPGLTSAEITASPAGTICIDWEDAAGAAIPDDTDVFELCFVATGQADTCYNISVIDSPLPVVTTTDGMGSMVYTDGELCVDDRLVIIGSTIDSIGCDGICDATAAVEVVGGSGEYRYYWKAEPIDQFTPVAENLCEGQVIVTVYDENDLDLSVTDTFFIVASGNVPGAMVNSDTVSIGCDPALALLSGTASGISGQPGESQQWYRLTGNVPLTPAGAASVFATLPGRYYFEVRNADGCVARDTALVVQSGGPIADAGEGFTLDCFSDVFQLDGTGSAQGDNVTYHWTGPAGLFLEDTASIIPRINGPGTYTLEVTDNISSCTSTSQVTIGAAPAAPESTATPFELELGCDGSSVTFDGAGSFNPGRNVSFEWYDLEETTLLSSDTTLSVNQLGCYVLIVRDIDSNCAARDTVCVVPNAGAPIVAAGEDQTLNCNVDTVTIMATVGPDTIDFTFDWMAIDGGPLVPGTETSLTPQATNPGTYVITAVNTANNCEATDTIVVVLDTIAPMIDAGPPVILNCSMPLDTLFGVISSGETDVTIIWTGPAGDTLGNELMLIIQDEGTYCMEVINNATGCSAIDCTEATIDGIPPMIIIENFELDLTCTNDTLTLTPDDITPPNPAYEISWETEGPDAAILTTSADGLTITVATPGIYRIVVTDPANGCAGENEFIIDVNNAIPVSDAGENASITCTDATAEIGGTTSTIGDDIIYLWTNTIDGEAPNPNNTMTITVGTAGTYELLVRDTITGCEATSQVEVTPDFEVANIVFSDPAMLTCADSCADLTATIDNISDFSVSWSSLNGGSPDPADQLITSVCEAGGFVLTVTNNANGCVVSDTVFVTENMDPPAIVIATPLEFGCEDTSVTLDASGTGVVGDFSLIEWSGPGTITPATGSLVVEVSTPGDYDLHVVRADNGCEDTQTVSVVPDPDFPEADAGVDFDMECGETSVLDGTASSAGDYQWTVISGTPLTGDVTSLTPEVTGAGVYELIVSNATNGCEDRDTVEVSLNLPADVAVVGADINTCQDSVEITATPVSGTVSGMWINLSLADLADPSAATTTASNLPTGNSLFVWSLSAPGCENYDSDTLIVSRANNPAVANDLLQISAEEREGVINIIANDGLGVTSGFTITLLNDPEIGTVDSLVNGVLYFSVGQGIFGEANITYEVCIDACPDLCGTANITIQIADDGFEPELPNTITPNGDGINDALVFDALLGKPAEDVPDNELIVFNRWGDIVYEARPYNNDWKGVNESGDDLPQGTYYYILRLKIGSGEIIRGDITIVK